MTIQRYTPKEMGGTNPCDHGKYVLHADHEERIADLERQLGFMTNRAEESERQSVKDKRYIEDLERQLECEKSARNAIIAKGAELERQLAEARAALQGVIDSAVEPETAKYASMVKLEPIRAAMKESA